MWCPHLINFLFSVLNLLGWVGPLLGILFAPFLFIFCTIIMKCPNMLCGYLNVSVMAFIQCEEMVSEVMVVCLRVCAASDDSSVRASLVVVHPVCCHLLEEVAAVVLNQSFHLLSPRLVCLAICLLLAPPTRPCDGISTALWAGLVDIDTTGNLQLHTTFLRLWYTNASKH